VILFIRLLKESFLFAYTSVIANKLRTFLTLLGITIGIFAIIAVFTVLNSLEDKIRNSISSLGSDIIYVQKWPWSFGSDYPWWEYMKRPVPKYKEYEELKRRSKFAEAVCFSVSTGRTIKYKNNTAENMGVWVNTHEFGEIRSFELAKGRYFTLDESESVRNVGIIGHEMAVKLFEDEDPIGKQVSMAGRKITVIGVVSKEGKDMIGGGSLDEMILLPMNYGATIFDIKSDRMNPFIWVKAKNGVKVADLNDEITQIMRSVRRIKPLDKETFSINQASMLAQGIDNIFFMINMAGWIIGGFSILVGGFGIANIMFVSVKERTRIIGIQKALGAKRYTILVEFLYESILLSLAGGILGLILVYIGTLLAKYIADFEVAMTFGNIVRGLLISGIIGVVSGFLPAYTASRMNPVDAINTHF
jgi:putative ABC transport system permease protein